MDLQTIALTAGKKQQLSGHTQAVDIITFIESQWGLNIKLFPVQRVILKAHYGIPLDDKTPNVRISDWRRQNWRTMTEAEYLRMLYDEGRCNIREVEPGRQRRELILSIGRRSGKCVLGDSLVLTDGGVRRIEELGDPDGPEIQPLEVGVAQEGDARSQSAYFYNGGVKPTRTLTTHCGYRLGGTHNHRIKVLTEQGTVEWRYLADMQVGDTVCIHRNTDLWASEYIDCTPFHNGKGRKALAFPDRLTEDWGRLLGYLVGDGLWNYKSRVEVTVEHHETWEALKSLYTNLLGDYSVLMDKWTENTGCIKFNSVGMRAFLHDLGFRLGTDRDAKMVPWSIFQSPRPVVQAFLRGLFETDGGVEADGKVVSFSTASGRLAREVQTLLLNLGIVSRIRPKAVKGNVYWSLTVQGLRHRRAFADLVGFDSRKKMGPLLDSLGTEKEGGRAESIPHQRGWCRRLLESIPKGNRHTGNGWERASLREVLGNTVKSSATDDLTYPRLAEVLLRARELGADPEVITHFEHLEALDYFFDPVVGIEDGVHPVYDLNVPEGHSFVANGMTNHNTFICACIATYEVYKLILKGCPQAYYGLPKTNNIGIISVATDKDQAGLLYNEASGHFSNCFAPETEVITSQGIKPIKDLEGLSPTILTGEGSWREAPVRSFGVQRLYRLTLKRQGKEKVVYCTGDHRWFARDHRKKYRGKGFQEFKTLELRPGVHRLQQVYGRSYKNKVKPSPFGVAHGFTFGDGSTSRGLRHAASVCLVGEKDSVLAPYFDQCPSTPQPDINAIRYGGLPNFFRDLPSIQENHSYLLGWLMGYLAADGSVYANGQVVLASKVRKNIEFVRDVCAVLGIGTFSIQEETRTSNLTGRPHTMFSVALSRAHLDDNFFLIEAHRENFIKAGGSDLRHQTYWTVQSVEPTDRVEEVFCATVDGIGSFALADNIATGNCAFFKPHTANNTQSYARFQTPHDINKYGRYSDDPTAKASIKVSFRSCVAKGLRGAGNIVIILDELAHFNDNGQSDAKKIYSAVKPSLAAFSPKDPNDSRIPIGDVEGRMISISSPLGRQGHFYNLFQIAMKGGTAAKEMLCIQAPTWEVNPTVEAHFLEGEYALDPVVFFTEYGAQFLDATQGWLENPDDLFACIDLHARPKVKGIVRQPHFAGVDIALVGDWCAIAIGHLDHNGKIVVDLMKRIRAGEGEFKHKERLDFDDVADWVKSFTRSFYISKGIFDQWAGIPFEQALHKRGLSQFEKVTFTKPLTSAVFKNFKDMMYDGSLLLYDWPRKELEDGTVTEHCDYIAELLTLQATYHSEYVTTVEAPKVKDAFDDLSDALVRMVHLASQEMGNRKYIAGTNMKGPRGAGRQTAQQATRARAKALQRSKYGGSSPDRQRSRVNRREVLGRG